MHYHIFTVDSALTTSIVFVTHLCTLTGCSEASTFKTQRMTQTHMPSVLFAEIFINGAPVGQIGKSATEVNGDDDETSHHALRGIQYVE